MTDPPAPGENGRITQIVAADIGGTNARFARATLDSDGRPQLGEVHKYKVAEHASLRACWSAFRADDMRNADAPAPRAAAIAFAAPTAQEQIKLTNSSWVIRPATLADELELEQVRLVNDFEAVAHAVSRLPDENLPLLFGPDQPFPDQGSVTVLGPGTGLGVALIVYDNGRPHIVATEGGHIEFAPLDALEDRILDDLRTEYLRVSVERIVSGPGLNNLYRAMAARHPEPVVLMRDPELWQTALDSPDSPARAALERLCLSYGSVAGDLALAHGAHSVVLAGSLTRRMRIFLQQDSGFYGRFTQKGRFQNWMRGIPVRLAVHPQIGLFGAAAAWWGHGTRSRAA